MGSPISRPDSVPALPSYATEGRGDVEANSPPDPELEELSNIESFTPDAEGFSGVVLAVDNDRTLRLDEPLVSLLGNDRLALWVGSIRCEGGVIAGLFELILTFARVDLEAVYSKAQ